MQKGQKPKGFFVSASLHLLEIVTLLCEKLPIAIAIATLCCPTSCNPDPADGTVNTHTSTREAPSTNTWAVNE